jgi:hypothetical protein
MTPLQELKILAIMTISYLVVIFLILLIMVGFYNSPLSNFIVTFSLAGPFSICTFVRTGYLSHKLDQTNQLNNDIDKIGL